MTQTYSAHTNQDVKGTQCAILETTQGIQHRVLTSGYNHRDTQNSAPTEDIHHDSEYN